MRTIWGARTYVCTHVTVEVINISITSKSHISPLVRKQHEIYPPKIFLVVQYLIVNYGRHVVHHVAGTYSRCITHFIPIEQWLPCPPHAPPGNHHSNVYFYTFDYFACLKQEESCSIYPFVTDISLSIMSFRYTHMLAFPCQVRHKC